MLLVYSALHWFTVLLSFCGFSFWRSLLPASFVSFLLPAHLTSHTCTAHLFHFSLHLAFLFTCFCIALSSAAWLDLLRSLSFSFYARFTRFTCTRRSLHGSSFSACVSFLAPLSLLYSHLPASFTTVALPSFLVLSPFPLFCVLAHRSVFLFSGSSFLHHLSAWLMPPPHSSIPLPRTTGFYLTLSLVPPHLRITPLTFS